MGPAIVTRDEVPDITALQVRTTVNGEERQAAPVGDLILPRPRADRGDLGLGPARAG